MATAIRRSGHARLKAALVLRDALAAELGLPLAGAMAQLRTVENNMGSAHDLTDGKYLEALSSVCQGDSAHPTPCEELWRRKQNANSASS